MAAGHVGRGPGLINEDQALRSQIELAAEPGMPLLQDVGTVLVHRVHGFFARDPVPCKEAMYRAHPVRSAALHQPRLNLDQGHVALTGNQPPDEAAVRLDLA